MLTSEYSYFLGEKNWRKVLNRIIKGSLEKGKVDLEELQTSNFMERGGEGRQQEKRALCKHTLISLSHCLAL